MAARVFMVVFLVIVKHANGDYEINSRRVTSIFKGKLYHKGTLVEAPQNLTQAELYGQVQRDVCKQIINMVPWYRFQSGPALCTAKIENNGHIYVNYTISATDEFLQSHDPSCSSYDILLDRLVQRNEVSGDGYYLKEMKLKTGSPAHSKSQSSEHVGSAVISLRAIVWKSGSRLEWNESTVVVDDVVEAAWNVKKQIVQCLNISSANENYIRVRPFGYQLMEYDHIYIRGRANITINKAMLIDNRINATCRSFEQLIKYCLESPFNGNNRSHYGPSVEITGIAMLNDTSDETTSSTDSTDMVNTTTAGGAEEQSSPNTTTHSSDTSVETTSSTDSTAMLNTTTAGGAGEFNRCRQTQSRLFAFVDLAICDPILHQPTNYLKMFYEIGSSNVCPQTIMSFVCTIA
ncbi:hypothetical protein EG68_11821 [Paragonimus skrjabini miyazakii]|uniref:Uncharacterized protein n=1 Tax=Paragonimus skrjabini miyazakii TaxID=59628 RepID=A0A8S9YEW8_9TREM|nr:hypothetical protein EG68_11821 [Paragonimus skrjabini miyazakii]